MVAFFPAMEQARHLIETGVIGDVVMVQADFDPLYTSQLVTIAFGLEAKPIDMKVCGTAGGPGGAILNSRATVSPYYRLFPTQVNSPRCLKLSALRGVLLWSNRLTVLQL